MNSDSLNINRELTDFLDMSKYHGMEFARIRTRQLSSPSVYQHDDSGNPDIAAT